MEKETDCQYNQIPGRRLVTYLHVRGSDVLHIVDPWRNELCGIGAHVFCGRGWYVPGGYKIVVRPRKVLKICRHCAKAYLERRRKGETQINQ